MSDLKKLLLKQCEAALAAKRKVLTESLSQIEESLLNETKSTAGDKHETGRAHMQIEQAKLQGMLADLKEQENQLQRISGLPQHLVNTGSVVETNHGEFFFAIALGKLNVAGKEIYVLSPNSPLGKQMQGKKAGDLLRVNNIDYNILSVQ